MKELEKIVNDKVAEMSASGAIQEAIETGVVKAINRAIESQFESFGSITKQIEEAMKSGLQINTNDLPFETYNQQMLVAIKGKLGDMFAGAAAEKFLSEIDKMLEPAPKELSVDSFFEKIAEFWKTDEPWDADDLDERATIEIDRHNDSCIDGISFKMWKKKSNAYGTRSRSEDLHLYVSADGRIRISHGQAYNPTCFDAHEAFIFKLYAAGTIITGIDNFDPDDCELTLKECDY